MNSKIVRIFLVMALALPAAVAQTGSPAAAAPAAPATAPAPTGTTKIGVISVQDAILATNEGQKEFEALGKKFEPKRAEI
jgi:outer membrane protein